MNQWFSGGCSSAAFGDGAKSGWVMGLHGGRFRTDPAHNCDAPCGVLATRWKLGVALAAQAGAFHE